MAYEMFPARRRRLCFNKNINNVNTQPMVNWPARLEMGINMDMGSSFWLPRALTEFMQKYVFFSPALPIFPTTINQKSSDILNGEAQQHEKATTKNCDCKFLQGVEGSRSGHFVIRSSMCELLWNTVSEEDWPLAYADGGHSKI